MNKTTKQLLLVTAGFILGVTFAYGFMYWQLYRKFNTVWACQVFTGQLSIEEQAHCKQFKEIRQKGEHPKYYWQI